MQAKQSVVEDLLASQDVQGTNLLYLEHEGSLIAIELDEEGDELARYDVRIQLEKL